MHNIKPIIILIGPPASGKSACGKELARQLAISFLDTDELIEQQESKSVASIMEESGEPYFRLLEQNLLENLISQNWQDSGLVLATGGGLPVCPPSNLDKLQKLGEVIYLACQLSTLVERIGNGSGRPLLSGTTDKLEAKLKQLLCKREPYYSQAALTVFTDKYNVLQVVEQIIELLGYKR